MAELYSFILFFYLHVDIVNTFSLCLSFLKAGLLAQDSSGQI